MVSLITWQKITWLNFHKIQNFICIQTCDRPNFKKPERKHTFMMSTQKGVGREVLKNCHVFADFIVLNIRSIVHFWGWWKWEGHLLVIFWTSYMGELKDNNNTKKNKCLESKRVQYSQNFKFNYKTNGNLIISRLTQISRATPLIRHLLFQSQQWKRQNSVQNMFKVNKNNDDRKRSITSS